MDDAQIERPVGRGNILQHGTGHVRESLVDVRWPSFARRAPDHDRHGVDQLPKLLLAPPQRIFGLHLIVDVVAEAVPLDDAPGLIPHRLRTARHPAIHAIGATEAIAQGEGLAGGEATVEDVPKCRRIAGMDGFYDRIQSALTWFVGIRDVKAEEIDHALVEENRIAVRGESPDMARNHIHEL